MTNAFIHRRMIYNSLFKMFNFKVRVMSPIHIGIFGITLGQTAISLACWVLSDHLADKMGFTGKV